MSGYFLGITMVRRLMKAGNRSVVYDVQPHTGKAMVEDGAVRTASLEDFAHNLKKPRSIWLMAPAAVVNSMLKTLTTFLERDDVIIDRARSYYPDDLRRAAERFSSRAEADFADKVLSAPSYQFDGHEEQTDEQDGGAK